MPADLVIGVTGHRMISEADLPNLEKAVKSCILDIKAKHPHAGMTMLNSLAIGADQLCARVALTCGVKLTAVLPMGKAEYEKDFDGEDLQAFQALLGESARVLIAEDFEKQGKTDRDYRYRQAGIHIVNRCRILLCLWDGMPSPENGCGTSSIVDYALSRENNEITVIQIVTTNGRSALEQ